MAKTYRKNYRGDPSRDGQWAKRCPESNCDWCVIGQAKRPHRRKERHTARRELRSGR